MRCPRIGLLALLVLLAASVWWLPLVPGETWDMPLRSPAATEPLRLPGVHAIGVTYVNVPDCEHTPLRGRSVGSPPQGLAAGGQRAIG